MGQTDSKQEQDFLRKIDSQYEFIKHLNDARYGDGKLFGKKNDKLQMIVLKNISIPDEASFQTWKNKLLVRQSLKHSNIIELKESIQAEEEQVCNTFFKVNLVFEYIPQTLQDAIEQRKQAGAYYGEQEVLQMLIGSINGLAKMQELKIAHQNLRVQTLSYLNGTIKVSDIPLLANITSFAAVLQDYGNASQGNYLSPILTKAVFQSNHMPQHNLFKSDVYTLGMIFLQVCLLQPQDNCYDYFEGKINMQQLVTNIEQARTIYTSELVEIIEEMLEQVEKDRPDFIQLRNKRKEIIPQLSNQLVQKNSHQQEDQYQMMFYENIDHQFEVNQSVQPSYLDEGPLPLSEDNYDEQHQPFKEPKPANYNDHDILIHNADITRNSISPMKQNNSIGQIPKSLISEFQVQPISFAQNNNNILNQDIYKVPEQQKLNIRYDSYTNTQKDYTNHLKQDSYTQSSQLFNKNNQQKSNIQLQQYVTTYQPQRESLQVNDYLDKFHFSSPNDIKQFEQNNQIDYNQPNRESYQYYSAQPQSRFMSTQQQYQQQQQQQQQPIKQQQNYQPISAVSSYLPKQNLSTYINETYSNGQRYVGEKINGKKEGRGRLYYKEGGYYDGYWKNDKINGQGVLYYASGRPAYDGEWVDDKFQGQGILYNDTPKIEDINYRNLEDIGFAWTKYVGQFYDDNKNGLGTLYFLNGDRFEGYFQDDQVQGQGRYISIGGQVIQGIWNFNHFVQ
ncbi:unnamed protein product [Paramecium primaurelia]|uniref:Protein kinase domain-containing protein n=1 Tax=Paramecium primaurelia TaxID=5886 RepID=A0A8S1LA15_PARPR|nr:unnamed protein product [Paramecium primaurelia]